MYFITTKRMLEVCFSAHPNIQYRTFHKSALLLCAKIRRKERITDDYFLKQKKYA